MARPCRSAPIPHQADTGADKLHRRQHDRTEEQRLVAHREFDRTHPRAEHQSRYAPDQRGKSYRRHDHRDNWPAQQLAQHHAFEREAERDHANDSLRAFGLNLNQSKGLEPTRAVGEPAHA